MSKHPLSPTVSVRTAIAVFLSVLFQEQVANCALADDQAGLAVVKQFVASLRYGDERIGELQKLIDPRYLQKHRRQDRDLSFEKFVTKSIYDLQLTDDPQTIVCTASTEESEREMFLFRTTIYEDNVYLLPLAPPDPTTGSFKPWILRMKQSLSREDRQTAGGWRVEFANGVTQVCHVREDGTASVVEPRRTSAGKTEIKDGSVVIIYEDDRVERWTPVGNRRIVEHWFPGSQFTTATPVIGIAERVQ
jgi:hypothetical protein